MKQIVYGCLFCLALLTLVSCRQGNRFMLKASMTDITDPYLLMVHDDPDAKIDTVYPREGQFIYTFEADTLNGVFRLMNQKGQAIPLFVSKGMKVELKGSFDQPDIKSEGDNALYMEFLTSIAPLKNDIGQIQKKAEAFITAHPQSLVSAYLINDYFVQTDQPDYKKIQQLIAPLSGEVKDSRVLLVITQNLQNTDKLPTYLPYVSYKDRSGMYFNWNNTDKTIMVFVVWASWDSQSTAEREMLWQLTKTYSKEQLKVYNISLDYDKSMWLSACKEDNEQWKEFCDFKGFQSSLPQQMHVETTPYIFITNNNREIKAQGLVGKELEKKIEALMQNEKSDHK